MRLNDFKDIDDYLSVSIDEYTRRTESKGASWIFSRQLVYSTLCESFPARIANSFDYVQNNGLLVEDMNPSQFVKLAQDYQLSARLGGQHPSTVFPRCLELANHGMKLRRKAVSRLCSDNTLSGLEFHEKKRSIRVLNTALRCMSETLYLDDHTVGGDLYSITSSDDITYVVREYRKLRSYDLYPSVAWPEWKAIRTVCAYNSGTVDIDALGNLRFISGTLPELVGWKTETIFDCSDRFCTCSHEDAARLAEDARTVTKALMESYNKLTDEERALLLLRATYYAYKPLHQIAQEDWEPTEDEVDTYLQKRTESTLFDKSKEQYGRLTSAQERNSYIQRILDPRLEL